MNSLRQPDRIDQPATNGATCYACPKCSGTVRRTGVSLRCPDCRYSPRHGAD